MKRSCLLFISGACLPLLASAPVFAANPDSTEFSVEVKPYLNVTLSDADIHLPITPSSTGAFGSADFSASASTNSALGYSLNLSYLDENDNPSTDLISNTINVNDGSFPTIPTFTTNDELTSEAFAASTSEDHLNHWAISVNDTAHYKKAVQGTTIASSNGPIADDETTINLATKLDLRTVPGSYSVVMNFQVVANPDVPDNNPINQAMGDAGKTPETIGDKQYYKMQDMTSSICNSITTPTAADYSDTPEAQLVDIRDGKLYWVAKLKDGNCWMTQNLDLNLEATPTNVATLTSENTDLNAYGSNGYDSSNGYSQANGVITWTPERSTVPTSQIASAGVISGYEEDNNNPYSVDVGNWYHTDTWYASNDCYSSSDCNYLSGNTNNKFSQTAYPNNGAHGHVGNYYNWSAAVASNNTSSYTQSTDGNLANNPQNSICPAGWRLPISTSTSYLSDNEFYNMLREYNVWSDYSLISASPVYFIRSGYIYPGSLQNAGYRGELWSSTVISDSYAHDHYFYDSTINPGYEQVRYYGLPVRCISK